MTRVISILILLATLTLIIIDARFHFDKERISITRQQQSAQIHWNWFYRQDYTYTDSPFRYKNDMQKIKQLIEPNTVLLSDKATSYYMAAELPVFIKNVQQHHMRIGLWTRILNESSFCYLDNPDHLNKVRTFIDQQAKIEQQAEFKYWVINRDPSNLNLRYDCLSTRTGETSAVIEELADLIYAGEYLWLYQIH